MIIGLDIDDTITRHPEFFALLSKALVAGGHECVVITFREDRDAAHEDLRQWGIEYTKLITSSLAEHLKYGVDRWKAAMCREHGVEILFDDDPVVIKHVDPSVLCLMPIDRLSYDIGLLADKKAG